MPSIPFFRHIFSVLALSLVLITPAGAKDNADASSSAFLVAASAKKGGAAAKKKGVEDDPVVMQQKLDEFAHSTIVSINRCIIPSSQKKEISKNADGSYTARYIEVDPASINTSYKKSDHVGPVSHIGYMRYKEVEYTCTAKSREEAANGPFRQKRAEMLTELIKYTRGKWTY